MNYKKNNGVDRTSGRARIGYSAAGMTPTARRLYGEPPGPSRP